MVLAAAYAAALLKAFTGRSPFSPDETDTARGHLLKRVSEKLDNPHPSMTVDGNTDLAVDYAVAYRILSGGGKCWTGDQWRKMLDYLNRFTTQYLGYYQKDPYSFARDSALVEHIARSQANHLILNTQNVRFTDKGIEVL